MRDLQSLALPTWRRCLGAWASNPEPPVASSKRQREDEARAPTHARLDPDAAAVRLDDSLGDGEAQARAGARVACAVAPRLPVAIEDVRDIGRVDARAVV